ncbi:hypothetical protein BT96DRAFT_789956, partial [Gymnopus androsaceus JB14]
LPDRIIASVSPIILIRHPAYTFHSLVRASAAVECNVLDPQFLMFSTFRWQRIVYEFYRSYYSGLGGAKQSEPTNMEGWQIVVDGDKLMEDPQGQMKKICELIGMDESLIQYSWNVGDDAE